MKKSFNLKVLLIIQASIILFLINSLCIIGTKKSRIVETKVVTSIPIFEETVKSQNKFAPTKNILFIGNSITWHEKTISWWGRWGMAVSKKENDYVHQFFKHISFRKKIIINILLLLSIIAFISYIFSPLTNNEHSVSAEFFLEKIK